MKKGELASLRIEVDAKRKLNSIQAQKISIMWASLEFYGITIKCPKCFHYHAEGHICFNCGYDSSIGGEQKDGNE